jgi:hypothetical protein
MILELEDVDTRDDGGGGARESLHILNMSSNQHKIKSNQKIHSS